MWCPRTDSNRGPIDYKSIALPAELQGHGLFFRLFSLVYQVIQQELSLSLARCYRSSQLSVAESRPFVTDKSVLKSVLKSLISWDFKLLSSFIKTNQWSGKKNETNKSYKN